VTERQNSRVHERWARLRFSVIGQLLAAPPEKGALRGELEKLAARTWRHPVTDAPVGFGVSTIERWYSAEQIILRSRTVPPRFSSTNTALRSA
jgi:putative transposase